MSDIDFDELDKAVNSIIGKKKGASGTSDIPSQSSNMSSATNSQLTTGDDIAVSSPMQTDNSSEAPTLNSADSLATAPVEKVDSLSNSSKYQNADSTNNYDSPVITLNPAEVQSVLGSDSSEEISKISDNIQTPPSSSFFGSADNNPEQSFSVPEPTGSADIEDTDRPVDDKTSESADDTAVEPAVTQRPRRGRFMDIKPSQQASGRPVGVAGEDTGANNDIVKPLDLTAPAVRRHSLTLAPVDSSNNKDSQGSDTPVGSEKTPEVLAIPQEDINAMNAVVGQFGHEDTGVGGLENTSNTSVPNEPSVAAVTPPVTAVTSEEPIATSVPTPEPDTSYRSVGVVDQPKETTASEPTMNNLVDNTSLSSGDTVTSTPEQPESLSSPFIPDAKVEKRPLGAPDQLFVSPENTGPTTLNDTADDLMDMEDSLPARPQDLKNESTATYEPQPTSSNEKTSGAVYDTDDYHQPLNHPAKKKSGWMVIVWLLVALLVGSVGGAAYFYFTNV